MRQEQSDLVLGDCLLTHRKGSGAIIPSASACKARIGKAPSASIPACQIIVERYERPWRRAPPPHAARIHPIPCITRASAQNPLHIFPTCRRLRDALPNHLGPHNKLAIEQPSAVPPVMHGTDEPVGFGG